MEIHPQPTQASIQFLGLSKAHNIHTCVLKNKRNNLVYTKGNVLLTQLCIIIIIINIIVANEKTERQILYYDRIPGGRVSILIDQTIISITSSLFHLRRYVALEISLSHVGSSQNQDGNLLTSFHVTKLQNIRGKCKKSLPGGIPLGRLWILQGIDNRDPNIVNVPGSPNSLILHLQLLRSKGINGETSAYKKNLPCYS